MLTRSCAYDCTAFHVRGDDGKCRTWRRNGRTRRWITRPGEYSVPVKFGLYAYGHITHDNAHLVHCATHEGCGAS